MVKSNFFIVLELNDDYRLLDPVLDVLVVDEDLEELDEDAPKDGEDELGEKLIPPLDLEGLEPPPPPREGLEPPPLDGDVDPLSLEGVLGEVLEGEVEGCLLGLV